MRMAFRCMFSGWFVCLFVVVVVVVVAVVAVVAVVVVCYPRMPNLAGVLDDGADGCGISIDMMVGSTPARMSRLLTYRRCEAFAVMSSIRRCHVRSCEIVRPSR